MAEPFSPAAQAMVAAYGSFTGGIDAVMLSERRGLAAAIRALVEQTVPEGGVFLSSSTAAQIRSELLAIAAELEGGTTELTTPNPGCLVAPGCRPPTPTIRAVQSGDFLDPAIWSTSTQEAQ